MRTVQEHDVQVASPAIVAQLGDTSSPCSCGSASAHASLRRFAEDYAFGASARLGAATSTIPSPISTTAPPSAVASVHPQHSPAPAPPSDNNPTDVTPATAMASPARRPFNTSGTDFRDLALARNTSTPQWQQRDSTSISTPAPVSTLTSSRNLSQRTTSASQSVHPTVSTANNASLVALTPSTTSSSALLTPISSSSVGTNQTTALGVRERRIDRRSLPKRLRDAPAVDALTAMLDRVLTRFGAGRVTKRARASSSATSASAVAAVAATVGVAVESAVKTGTDSAGRGSVSNIGASCSVGSHTVGTHEHKTASETTRLPLPETRDADETAEELSFLMERRCDLDGDERAAAFMPYIT